MSAVDNFCLLQYTVQAIEHSQISWVVLHASPGYRFGPSYTLEKLLKEPLCLLLWNIFDVFSLIQECKGQPVPAAAGFSMAATPMMQLVWGVGRP